MSKYRAVMATTVDCEGCPYDSKNGCKADYCMLFDEQKAKHKIVEMCEEDIVKKILELLSDEVHNLAKEFKK